MAPGLAMLLCTAACGDEQATETPAAAPPATTSVQPSEQPSAAPVESLTVKVKASEQAPAKTWTLTCDPPGGDHPKAAAACAALTKAEDPFKPVPANQACTRIYGGPATATVEGTWNGQRIDTEFSRHDGCHLTRWTNIAPLFGNVPKVR